MQKVADREKEPSFEREELSVRKSVIRRFYLS